MHRGGAPDPACPGCLGERRCWVCLGTGRLRSPYGPSAICHSCSGTGVCKVCRGGVEDDQPPPVVDFVPAPRATAHQHSVSSVQRVAAG